MIDLAYMRRLINRLPQEQFMVEKALSNATKITPAYSDAPKSNGGNAMEQKIDAYTIAKEKRNATRQQLAAMRSDLPPFVQQIQNPLQRTVFSLRYMEGMSVREIAYRLCYCKQYIHKQLVLAENTIDHLQKENQNLAT